jgi:hypothetical protein
MKLSRAGRPGVFLMTLLFAGGALPLVGCGNPDAAPPRLQAQTAEATCDMEQVPAVPLPPLPEGLIRPECNAASCINAALREARVGVLLEAGAVYPLDEQIQVPAGKWLAGAGMPRPVLLSDSAIYHGAMILENDAVLSGVAVHGPFRGQTRYPVQAPVGDFQYKGVNAANRRGWAVLDSDIDGWPGTGLLGVMAHGVRIAGNRIAHNGFSGISIFPWEGDCGSEVEIAGNVLDSNGQNGMDVCPSSATIVGNLVRWNGWDGHGGDSNGILHYSVQLVSVRDVRIAGNTTCENVADGIRVHGNDVRGLSVSGNRVLEGAPVIWADSVM